MGECKLSHSAYAMAVTFHVILQLCHGMNSKRAACSFLKWKVLEIIADFVNLCINVTKQAATNDYFIGFQMGMSRNIPNLNLFRFQENEKSIYNKHFKTPH